jgi:hypothetical protein
MERRAFLKTGLLSGSILITGTGLYGCSDLDVLQSNLIDEDTSIALAALLPVFLAGVLPIEEPQRGQTIKATIDGINTAMDKLPPHTLDDLNDLFGLLTNRLTMLAYAGTFSHVEQLSTVQKVMLVEGWRTSYLNLINTAYEGLKELVFAAFYGNCDNWPLIHYNKPDLGV